MIRFVIRKAMALLAGQEPTCSIKVVFANGSVYQTSPGDPQVTIVFKTRASEWRTVIFQYVGFMESYYNEQIDIEGEDALRKLMQMSYKLSAKRGTQHKLVNPLIELRDRLLEHRNNNKRYL